MITLGTLLALVGILLIVISGVLGISRLKALVDKATPGTLNIVRDVANEYLGIVILGIIGGGGLLGGVIIVVAHLLAAAS